MFIKNQYKILVTSLIIINLYACGTLVGGAKYNAHVKVKEHPNAEISYQGKIQGIGHANILIKRNQANNVKLIINEIGCQPYTHKYSSKTPRLGPILGTASEITQMILAQQIGIPLGSLIDLATGGYWKPNVKEPGLSKIDYDNFLYELDYPTCNITYTPTKQKEISKKRLNYEMIDYFEHQYKFKSTQELQQISEETSRMPEEIYVAKKILKERTE